jgi:hypothetical protein
MRLTVLILVLIHDFVATSPNMIAGDENDIICCSPDCVATSERLLKYMNLSVDPCDNFYQVIPSINSLRDTLPFFLTVLTHVTFDGTRPNFLRGFFKSYEKI